MPRILIKIVIWGHCSRPYCICVFLCGEYKLWLLVLYNVLVRQLDSVCLISDSDKQIFPLSAYQSPFWGSFLFLFCHYNEEAASNVFSVKKPSVFISCLCVCYGYKTECSCERERARERERERERESKGGRKAEHSTILSLQQKHTCVSLSVWTCAVYLIKTTHKLRDYIADFCFSSIFISWFWRHLGKSL